MADLAAKYHLSLICNGYRIADIAIAAAGKTGPQRDVRATANAGLIYMLLINPDNEECQIAVENALGRGAVVTFFAISKEYNMADLANVKLVCSIYRGFTKIGDLAAKADQLGGEEMMKLSEKAAELLTR